MMSYRKNDNNNNNNIVVISRNVNWQDFFLATRLIRSVHM